MDAATLPTGKRILIVEDEADLRYALAVRLKAAGFVCDTAQDGQEGLVKAIERMPDLIIADLLMPQMSGHEMLAQLKADPKTTSIPVVIITALPERARERYLSGFRSVPVMQKPFYSEELLAVIRSLLSGGGVQNGHRPQ